jgi:hypothetical protein
MYLQVKYWDLQEDTYTDELTPEEIVNDFKEGTLKFIGTYCCYYLYFKKYSIYNIHEFFLLVKCIYNNYYKSKERLFLLFHQIKYFLKYK